MLAELGKRFAVDGRRTSRCGPASAGEFGMYLAGRWYRLTIKPELIPANDPIGRLPITLLSRNVHRADVRHHGSSAPTSASTSSAAARGLGELERRVKSGEMAVAFALYPTQMADLMAVADAGEIMPPKIDLVRAEARRRHGQSRAGLSRRSAQVTMPGS